MPLQKKIVDVETINNLLSKAPYTALVNKVYEDGDKDKVGLRVFYWKDNRNNPNFVFRTEPKPAKLIHYVVKADEEEIKNAQAKVGIGRKAFNDLNRLLKKTGEEVKQTVVEQHVDAKSGRPFYSFEAYSDMNPEKSYYAEHCIQLDMNSCYLYFMQKPLPDQFVGYNGFVEAGQLGFNELITKDGTIALELVTSGYAKYIFTSKVYKSFVEYSNTKFALLDKLPRGSNERALEKAKAHALLGYLVRKNPFITATVVGYATKYIKSFQDEHWVASTVDSLVFIDNYIPAGLPIGNGLGQFKIEYADFTLIETSVGSKHYIFKDGTTLDKVQGASDKEHNLYFDPADVKVYSMEDTTQMKRSNI